jgi:uncharacterized membrane protein HdeD (DUF308 family)
MKNLKTAKRMLCIMGVVMFIMGVATLILPAAALTTVALMLGCGFVVAGIFCLISFFSEKEILLNPGWVLIQGILDIFIGFFLLWNLGPTIVAIPYIVAFWMMFGSIAKFAASFNLNRLGVDKWWLVLINGLLGIFISFLVMFFPFFGSSFLVALIGMYLMVYGILIFADSVMSKIPELKNFIK